MSEVEFWGAEDGEREAMVYPPRFTIRVHGEDAVSASVAQVSFNGTAEELSTEVVLPVRNKSGGSGRFHPLYFG